MNSENQQNDATVSIVVPVFNQESFSDKSIPAILAQEYSALQLVAVNDGSTDKSKSILEDYAKKDNRVVIVNQENKGLVGAVVSGIQAATGQYIAFVDPDDYVGIDFLKFFIDELDDDYDFIAAGINFEDCGKIIPQPLEQNHVFYRDEIPWLRTHYLLGNDSSIPSRCIHHSRWNKLYKAECVKAVASDFNEYKAITLGEDSIFTYLMLLHAKKGKAVQKVNSYFYNISNQHSMMNDTSIVDYLSRAKLVYTRYSEMMSEHNEMNAQPLMLYYMLAEALMAKSMHQKYASFKKIYRLMHDDVLFRRSIDTFLPIERSMKRRIMLLSERVFDSPAPYKVLKTAANLF